jgi:cyanophycinase
MPPVFLIGGGRDRAGVAAAHAPFLDAVDGPVLCVMHEEGLDVDRWVRGNLAGATVRPLVVSGARPLAAADLEGVAGVYVAGGWTPGYGESCTGVDITVPFAGFSAGAAIAARVAIVGGWRIGGRQVCQEEAGEGLDEVVLRVGLGLVPFAVDVHATQWGTVTRLANAVAERLVDEGVAIDEHTCVEVHAGEIAAVHGNGVAYHVRPGELTILR